MKLNPFNSPAYLIPAFALMSLPLAQAQISFDDGAVGDSNWTSADNWDTKDGSGEETSLFVESRIEPQISIGVRNVDRRALAEHCACNACVIRQTDLKA